MKIKLIVNKTNIKNGKRNNTNSCPVALALKRMRFADVCVIREGVFFVRNGTAYNCVLPKKIQKFIKNFDSADKVKPFECNIILKECGHD